jgi:hypothetical protein
MSVVKRDVWHCDVCGWEWVPSGDEAPQQCPKRSCRSRHWNAGVPAEPRRSAVKKMVDEGVGAKIPEKSEMAIAEYADEGSQEYEELDAVSAGDRGKAAVAKVVRKKKVEAGEPRPCRHGLTFHRGCNV